MNPGANLGRTLTRAQPTFHERGWFANFWFSFHCSMIKNFCRGRETELILYFLEPKQFEFLILMVKEVHE